MIEITRNYPLLAGSYNLERRSGLDFTTWREDFFSRWNSCEGLALFAGQSMGLPLLFQFGLSKLVPRPIRNHLALALLQPLLLSGAMILLSDRSKEKSGGQMFQQWLTGLIYLLPSLLIGVKSRSRAGLLGNFLQNLSLEAKQILTAVLVGELRETVDSTAPRMSLTERAQMETAEGVAMVFLGTAGRSIARGMMIATSLPRTRPGERLPHLIDCLQHRNEAVVLRAIDELVRLGEREPGLRISIRPALVQAARRFRDPVHGAIFRALDQLPLPSQPAPARISNPPAPEPAPARGEKITIPQEKIGLLLRRTRERHGISMTEMARRIGRRKKAQWVSEMRAGQIDLETLYLNCGVLYSKRLNRGELAALYEAFNHDLSQSPLQYQRRERAYLLSLPRGVSYANLKEMPLAVFVRAEMDRVGLNAAQLARQAGVRHEFVMDVLRGDTQNLNLAKLMRLQPALKSDPTLLYYMARKEMCDFIKVVERGTGRLLDEPQPGRFSYAEYRRRLLESHNSPEDQVVYSMAHSFSLGKQEAYRRFVRQGGNGRPYLEIPANWTVEAARKLDLFAELNKARGTTYQEAYLEQFGMQMQNFRRIVQLERVPKTRDLNAMAAALKLPHQVLLINLWDDLPKLVEIRRAA